MRFQRRFLLAIVCLCFKESLGNLVCTRKNNTYTVGVHESHLS